MEPVRVTPDDQLFIDRYASTTDSVLFVLRMSEDREGRRMRPRPVVFDIPHSLGNKTFQADIYNVPTGWIQGGMVRSNAIIERGTFYLDAALRAFGLRHTQLVFGQVYDGHSLGLGVFEDPLDSPGNLGWAQLGDDVAGTSNTIFALQQTNARRRWDRFLIKYHADATVEARTVQLLLREVADDGGPTGFGIAEYVWGSAVITLTADEEGILYVGVPGFTSFNDETTLTYADNTTAPHPFPYWAVEGDSADIVALIGNGQAGDDYDFWGFREEWIEV